MKKQAGILMIPPAMLLRSFHSFNKFNHQADIRIGHRINIIYGFLLYERGRLTFIEKFHGCDTQIFADI